MVRSRIQKGLTWVRRGISKPRAELDRWEYAVRFCYELAVHGWRALERDDAPQMAAALSFRSLFALLPVIVVSAVLVNAMQGPNQFKGMVHWVVDATGVDTVNIQVPPIVQEAEEGPEGEEEQAAQPKSIPLSAWLENWVDDIAALNLAALGWLGMAVVVYSAISLMVTIENSFNALYGAPEGRSWAKRIPMYWFVLTLGPLFVGLTLVMDNQVATAVAATEQWGWLLGIAKQAWSFCLVWIFMFAVYALVPNTRVMIRAALLGSFVAAILLVAGKNLLGAYFQNAMLLGGLAATIGAVPVFMFWMYLMWLAILFGLEVSATIQRVQGLHLQELQELKEKRPQTGLVDPASVLGVMEIATQRFVHGRAVTSREIADEGVLSEAMVTQMIDRLVREGFLHRVDGQDGAVTLARPPELIPAQRLIEVGYDLVDEGRAGPLSAFVQRLRDAQRNLAAHSTLATLLQPKSLAPADQVPHA